MRANLIYVLFLILPIRVISQDEIVLGAILPMSGSTRALGEEGRQAIENALSDTPHKRFRYRLVVEDDQFSAAKAASAARKLASIDQARVIFSNYSYGGNAVGSSLRGQKVIHLANAWDSKVLDYGDNNFIISPPPELLAQKAIERIAGSGVRTISLLQFQEAGCEQMMRQIKLSAASLGISVLDQIEIAVDDLTSIRTVVLKVKKQQPQYLATCLIFPLYVELFRQMQQQKADIPVMGLGQAHYDKAFKNIHPKNWMSVDYQASGEDSMKIRERTGLQDFSGYPVFYEATKAVISAYEETPLHAEPTIEFISGHLQRYTRTNSLIGTLSMKDRRFHSDSIIFVNQALRY